MPDQPAPDDGPAGSPRPPLGRPWAHPAVPRRPRPGRCPAPAGTHGALPRTGHAHERTRPQRQPVGGGEPPTRSLYSGRVRQVRQEGGSQPPDAARRRHTGPRGVRPSAPGRCPRCAAVPAVARAARRPGRADRCRSRAAPPQPGATRLAAVRRQPGLFPPPGLPGDPPATPGHHGGDRGQGRVRPVPAPWGRAGPDGPGDRPSPGPGQGGPRRGPVGDGGLNGQGRPSGSWAAGKAGSPRPGGPVPRPGPRSHRRSPAPIRAGASSASRRPVVTCAQPRARVVAGRRHPRAPKWPSGHAQWTANRRTPAGWQARAFRRGPAGVFGRGGSAQRYLRSDARWVW
jgi:translation initiation factor IF-2